MTLNLMRSLWLWAGALTLALLAIVPLSTGLRTIAVLAVACLVILAWIKTGRLAARQSEALVMADGMALPSQAYRRPVVLVCGDGLIGLFGAVPVDQLAVRVTEHGCYLRVPELGQLSAMAESILTVYPDWRGQLSVMYVVNCAEHSDTEELAGRVRTCCHQITLIRKRGISLPLLLVSYLEGVRGQGPWFSWEADQASPIVRDADTCVSLSDWQRQLDDGATQALRLQTSVQLNAVADWLSEEVLPHMVLNDSRSSMGLPRLPMATDPTLTMPIVVLPTVCITQPPAPKPEAKTRGTHLWVAASVALMAVSSWLVWEKWGSGPDNESALPFASIFHQEQKLADPVHLDSLSLFDAGSAELKPGATKILINALVSIKAQPGWLIVITGHSDTTGDAAQNMKISQARAAAVRDWMQGMGDIPDSCFAVQGLAASQPLLSNDTESGRAANRRVDIRLVPQTGACEKVADESNGGPAKNS
jgi:outer membrane protein OmpA-like peptidoglycan-associated protein